MVYNRNREGRRRSIDDNGFLVRPALLGDRARRATTTSAYLGYNGDGHFGRLNLTASAYGAFGRRTATASSPTSAADIRAGFAAAEASLRFRLDARARCRALYASGDKQSVRQQARPASTRSSRTRIFAGADTSYWIRQSDPAGRRRRRRAQRRATACSTTCARRRNRASRTSTIPGLRLLGVGADFDLTPQLRVSANAQPALVRQHRGARRRCATQAPIARSIGWDAVGGGDLAAVHVTQNIVFRLSGAVLLPGERLQATCSTTAAATAATIRCSLNVDPDLLRRRHARPRRTHGSPHRGAGAARAAVAARRLASPATTRSRSSATTSPRPPAPRDADAGTRPTPRAAGCVSLPHRDRRARRCTPTAAVDARLHRLPRRRRRRVAPPAAMRRAGNAAPYAARCATTGARAAALSAERGTIRRAPTRSAATRCSTAKRPSSSASSIPATTASRAKPAAPATCRSIAGGRAQPDGDGRDVLGRRRVQQRHPAVQELHPRRGLYARRASRPRSLDAGRRPTPSMARAAASLPTLYPLPTWETMPPGDIFRVFERGGRNIGTPVPRDRPAQRSRASSSGSRSRAGPTSASRTAARAPAARIAIPVLNIHKTRLNDPHLWFLGTNDQPGDYRSSGCTGCHVVYANDREPRALGDLRAVRQRRAQRSSVDPTIPQERAGPSDRARLHARDPDQPVHDLPHAPAEHLPEHATSATRCGTTSPTRRRCGRRSRSIRRAEEMRADPRPQSRRARRRAASGATSDFLRRTSSTLNPTAEGHAVRRLSRPRLELPRASSSATARATCSTRTARSSPTTIPKKFKKAVHLKAIHVEKGMQCVDCHFAQDGHGNGYIYGEVAARDRDRLRRTATAPPTAIRRCDVAARPRRRPARDLTLLRNPGRPARFEWRRRQAVSSARRSTPGLEWKMTPGQGHGRRRGRPHYNEKAARAHKRARRTPTRRRWGAGVPQGDSARTATTRWPASPATSRGRRAAAAATCRSRRTGRPSATTTRAARRATSRPTTRRSRATTCSSSAGTATIKGDKHRAGALVLGAGPVVDQHQPRAHLRPAAADLGERASRRQAFAPHYPAHRAQDRDQDLRRLPPVRRPTTTTRSWRSCCCWAPTSSTSSAATPGSARSGGVEAVRVTEWDEPQAVIGSYLQRYAYPDWYKQHQDARPAAREARSSTARASASCLQLRGEYLYVAEGAKRHARLRRRQHRQQGRLASGSSRRRSRRSARTRTSRRKNATCVALPTNQPIDPRAQPGRADAAARTRSSRSTRSTTTRSSPTRRKA